MSVRSSKRIAACKNWDLRLFGIGCRGRANIPTPSIGPAAAIRQGREEAWAADGKIVKGVFGTVGIRKSQAGGGGEKWAREGAGTGRIIGRTSIFIMLQCKD